MIIAIVQRNADLMADGVAETVIAERIDIALQIAWRQSGVGPVRQSVHERREIIGGTLATLSVYHITVADVQ